MRTELDEVAADLQRLAGELPDGQAALVTTALAHILAVGGMTPAEAPLETMQRVRDLAEQVPEGRTWTGETAGEAVFRAYTLSIRKLGCGGERASLDIPDHVVSGEPMPPIIAAPGDGSAALIRGAGGRWISGATWPERGYGPGLIDVTRLMLQEPWTAVTHTVRLRDPIEVKLETAEPRRPAADRVFTARCTNNSSKPLTVQVAVTAPGEGWTLTPAQSEPLAIPARESLDFDFTAQPPAGVMTMAPMRVTATSGEETLEADAQAMCGEPARPDPNLARAEGVEVTVSGSYGGGYNPAPINDGLFWPTGVHWTEIAWASREAGGDDWIQFTWPRAVTVSRVVLYWHIYPELPHTPRQLLVQAGDGDGWRDLADVVPDPGEVATTVDFEAATVTALRIVQPAGQGPAHRPNLMWVTEAQVGR
jgi:hypothetical protein